MPWPMVHFAVSDKLSNGKPTDALLLGSIAPDAIHMRGTTTKEQKGATHLVQHNRLPSAQAVAERMQLELSRRADRLWRDFVIGYFSHIYTDARWTDTIYAAFEVAYPGGQQTIRKTYNFEMSQLEFGLMRSQPHAEQWLSLLQQCGGYGLDPLVSEHEVLACRDSKLEWLRDPGREPGIDPVYFPLDTVERFIEDTACEWQVLLRQAGL